MFRFTIRGCCIAVLLTFLCYSEDVAARGSRLWTYKDLSAEADIVCIGTIASTRKAKNVEFFPDHLDRFDSQVKILTVLKGDARLEKVVFVHFKYRADIRSTLGNGPTFAVLDDATPKQGPAGDEAGRAARPPLTFLFFLRRRDDVAYGPVSGDDDAAMSVARLDGFTDDD